MIEDVFEGILKVLGRFLGYFFFEIVLELLIRGPGYLIAKTFIKPPPDPDSLIVAMLGILLCCLVSFGIYAIF